MRFYALILCVCGFSLIGLLFTACNPAKQINAGVAQKSKQEVKVQFPQTHVATPENINFVYDYEELYTQQQEKQLDSLLRVFEQSNLIAIKLTSLNGSSMQTADFNANNALLYKEWDKTHGGSGKVIVVGLSKGQQKIKLDYGPFVAKLLSEAEVAKIIQDNNSFLQEGNYFTSAWNGLSQLMDIIRKNIGH